MKTAERIQDILQQTAGSLAMIARIILKSKRIPQQHESPLKPLMILGNGPSLKQTLSDYADTIWQLRPYMRELRSQYAGISAIKASAIHSRRPALLQRYKQR